MPTFTMTTNNKKPVLTLRDGGIKAAIWFNSGPKGDFHSVKLSRTYCDKDGVFHETDRFSGTELLRVALLATRAYEHFAILKPTNKPDAEAWPTAPHDEV